MKKILAAIALLLLVPVLVWAAPKATTFTVLNAETQLQVGGVAITATPAEINAALDGATVTTAEINTLDLSAVGAIVKVKQIAISADYDNTEQDSGWDLPAKCIVLDVFIDVTTADASQTIDIGTSGTASNDADGFVDAGSVNATGQIRGAATVTSGTNEVYFASTTRGVLLSTIMAGSDASTDVGTYYEFYDVSSGGESVTYTGSDSTNTARGNIYILYIELE